MIAIFGAVVGLLLTPFMDTVWVYEPGIDWLQEPFIARTFGPSLESSGLLTFGAEGLPYEVFGKGFVLVYLLMIPVIRGVRPAAHRSALMSPIATSSWSWLHWAVWIGACANIASYWGSSVPGVIGEGLFAVGTQIELLAVVTILGSTVVFCFSALRVRFITRGIAAVSLLAIGVTIPVNMYLTSYLPNSIVVPLSVGWAVIGLLLWLRSPISTFESAGNVTA